MSDTERRLAAVLEAASWPDGQRDGFPSQKVAGMLAAALLPVVAEIEAEARAGALREALSGVTTHNGTPVTPKNLRWAATHEALCRSYVFDVLTGLADSIARTAEEPKDA